MFVCYVIMLIISYRALQLCIETHESQTCLTLAKKLFYYGEIFNVYLATYGVTFREKSLIFDETDCSFFFFEERASQTQALGPVSTVLRSDSLGRLKNIGCTLGGAPM